jgi:hypothetical protein
MQNCVAPAPPLEYDQARHVASLAFYSLLVSRIRRTCLTTEQRKVSIESLRSQAESLGLSMHKGDSEGLYYLAKEEPESGESRRIGPDMGPDDIAAFLTEETAVRAALRPTCWLAEVSAKSDTVSVIVEVVAKDADAPELAYEQASRFVATKYGASAELAAKRPSAVPAQKPSRDPDGHSPEPLSCPVWIVGSGS